MKKIVIAILLLIIPSIYVKTRYEVDYFVEETEAIGNIDIDDYFSGTNFRFERFGQNNEYIGLNGDCLIIAGPSNRDGNSDAIFEATHRRNGTNILFLYKGILSSSPPYFRGQLDHYLEMLRVAVGDRPKVELILHLAVQSNCKPEDFHPLAYNHDINGRSAVR